MTASPAGAPADIWRSVPHRMSIGLNHQLRDDGSLPSENLTCFVFAFPGLTVDVPRLERALARAVAVNPALAHCYRVDPDYGPQYREADWRPTVYVVEPPGADEEGVWAEARRVADAEMLAPFDLRDGRLLRVVCVRGSSGAGTALVIKVDHTVCDGLSYAQLLDDLSVAYGCDDEAENFAPTRRRASLARVAAAERRALAGAERDELRAAWHHRLPEGVPDMVLGKPTPWRACTAEGEQAAAVLTGGAYKRHARQAADLSVSSFMLATAKLLHAMRASVLGPDLSFFSPFPGRFVPAARGVLGNFVSVLPVTVDVPRAAGLPATVEAVREGVLWTMHHQGIPFDAILEAVGNADATSGEFAYQRRSIFLSGNPVMRLELEGIRGELSVPTLTDAMFDLSLWISDTGSELRVSGVFRKQLLDRALVEAWLAALS
ncbi:condensation domain-containing protein [Streptomyces sp. NBC_01637]|uniref:condensation domain-containing protein n=1 Tax=unclassified Streptomyces TaxID=2593676 RepID=UPI00386E00D8|nr:condensation domain-containing protein [Streptomyces sp. NBC_01653]WTC84584.1 condensation domain-containing protein [Streptomyces sp. NBC_01653]WTD86283.1 condensation domain-containing protein [Streptomyces sp. NBC_01637]WTD94241.1 condensation domain-containing protein [Streptomyces sp. NBC_01637]